jgi:hypothetical protein
MKAWKKLSIFVLIGVFTVSMSRSVFAQQAESTNYGVDQAYFGSGGELEMNSNNYRAAGGAGDSASGAVRSANYSSETGSFNSSQPLLELTVGGGDDDHGLLDSDQTYYGDVSVDVRAYTSSGYIMQLTGLPPHQTVHTIPGLASPQASQAGTEQFGINLRKNTTPNVGTEPAQFPDASFAYGIPAPDYNTANLFKYVSGDIIAQSGVGADPGVGETHYTLSYILNLNPLTPAGRYEADLSVVVSAKF